ncbi:MAG: hypothetical protein RDV48_31135 [Candidatus Eremiobacteraeota bacterium]|nr:hypothetical protein [Candidatus Eremiobacteraeota bacterium]
MITSRWYFLVLVCLVLLSSGCGGGGGTESVSFQSGGEGAQSFLEPDTASIATDPDEHFLFVAN